MKHIFSLEAGDSRRYYSEYYHLPVESIGPEGQHLHPYEGVVKIDNKLVELLIEGETDSSIKITAFWPGENTPEGSDDYEDYECLTYWDVNSVEEAIGFVEGIIRKYDGKIDEITSALEDEGFGT